MSDPRGRLRLTKGNNMLNQAVITHVHNGVESVSEVEAEDLALFYAKIVGAVQGITMAGAAVTKIATLSDAD
jgi:hypothetical protein